MFILLKLIIPFLLPPTQVAAGLLIALWLLLRKKTRAGAAVLSITLLFYYLFSTVPAAYLLARSLERAIPSGRWWSSASPPEAIVVLAGSAKKAGPSRPRRELGGASWKRLWHGVELYRNYGGSVPLIYSGGSGNLFDSEPVGPELAREYALSMGVAAPDFWTEEVSRNTYENGREIRRLLDERFGAGSPHRIVVVTSAIHMARALLIMEKAGLDAVPAPADFPFDSFRLNILSFLPSAGVFALSTACIYEWIGIAGYRLLGRL